MEMTLLEVIQHVACAANDTYNHETYLNISNFGNDEINFRCQYVLGNLFIAGTCESRKINYQIYKDHSTWQIWIWKWSEEKSEYNQFNTPFYNYDKVIEFIEKSIA